MVFVRGRCHCAAVQFVVRGIDARPKAVARCNCSLCIRKGALMALVAKEQFELLAGAEFLNSYRWNSGIAEHFFCRICGIYTHHSRRGDPGQYGVNVGCLEGAEPLEYADQSVALVDGKNLPLE